MAKTSVAKRLHSYDYYAVKCLGFDYPISALLTRSEYLYDNMYGVLLITRYEDNFHDVNIHLTAIYLFSCYLFEKCIHR